MKKLMYLSISMLCLAITLLIGFHIGSHPVQAQAPEVITGYRAVNVGSGLNILHFVMLSNGDVYVHQSNYDGPWSNTLQYVGNFWEGGVPTAPATWGEIKGKYKGE